jgi:hypothetical protein
MTLEVCSRIAWILDLCMENRLKRALVTKAILRISLDVSRFGEL